MKKFINKLLNKPYISIIFLYVFNYIFIVLISSLLTVPFFFLTSNYETYEIICNLLDIIVSVLALFLFKLWFKEEYQGSLKGNIIKGIIYIFPLIIIFINNLIVTVTSESQMSNAFVALVFALAPGISEEVLFRGFIIPNYLRLKNDDLDIVKIMIISSLIFGFAHITNLFYGAGLSTTLLQVLYTFAIGTILAAVFIRTGSLVPSIIAHTLIDYTAFLGSDLLENGGLLEGDVTTISILFLGFISILFIIYAYYLIRKVKRDKIREVWKDKWNINVQSYKEEIY